PNELTGETVLIVDDEEPIRKTFQEWLAGADFGCRILSAADADAALVHANNQTIDLAILDWNLGAGNDGLQLLEDLAVFNPDVAAIMITGFAHQATPLDAMRMGVRDYLDKNQDLDHTTFLRAVKRQLERIRPARRERQIHEELVRFRSTVEKVLPLVQSSAALNDPVPLPAAIHGLFRFLLRTTGARDGVLLVHTHDSTRTPAEGLRAFSADGQALPSPEVQFSRSLAGSVVSLQAPAVMADSQLQRGNVELQAFERGRQSILAAPLPVAPGYQAVLEIFDKPGGFDEADRHMAAAAADFGAEMLRHALAERETHRVLFDAMAAALDAGDKVTLILDQPVHSCGEEPPPSTVLDSLRVGLSSSRQANVNAEATLKLVEAIRVLAVKHGPNAVKHCIEMVEGVRALLDSAAGYEETRP
ncbi:MAG: response regulator, partial [Candidatus Acidiferrum sp.]